MATSESGQTIDSQGRFSQLRQGHILSATELNQEEGDESYVLISQTCDIVLEKRPTISVAFIRELADDELTSARKKDNPRYVALPHLGGTKFADLGYIRSLAKSDIDGQLHPVPGIDLLDDHSRREFALAVGRWFSRFAFPDDVVPWLRPVLGVIRQKHDRPESPLGILLNKVVEFRIEASNWLVRPLDLTLHVIMPAGSIPTLDEPPQNNQLSARLRSREGAPKAPSAIAEILLTLTEPGDLFLAWSVLAEALGALCHPREGELNADVKGAVLRVTGQLSSDDEFTLGSVRRSEILDLDYLSIPTPYA